MEGTDSALYGTGTIFKVNKEGGGYRNLQLFGTRNGLRGPDKRNPCLENRTKRGNEPEPAD